MNFSLDYEHRGDAALSALLGKSTQHIHRFAAFIQTIEYSYDMCMVYLDRFNEFPPLGKIDDIFIEHLQTIFEEAFSMGAIAGKECRLFLINDEVAGRAIDFVSGQIQQMKLLMDDTNAPIWGGSQGRSVIVLPVNGGDCNSAKDKHEKQKKRKKTGMTYLCDAVSAVILCRVPL